MSALTGLSGLSGYVGGGAVLGTPVFRDTFTRADSATSLGTPDVGGPWGVSGTWGVSSGKGYSVTDADQNAAAATTGLADGTYLATVQGGLTAANYRLPLVLVRYADPTHTLAVQVYNGQVQLYKIVGSSALAQGAAVATPDGVPIRLRILCQGANVKVYCDDVAKIDYTLSGPDQAGLTGTAFGMKLVKSGTPTVAARWDDLAAYAAVLPP